MSESELISWSESGMGPTYWKLTLSDRDARSIDREQLEMIQDGLWLIAQGLKRRVEGPLNTPRLRLPIRS